MGGRPAVRRPSRMAVVVGMGIASGRVCLGERRWAGGGGWVRGWASWHAAACIVWWWGGGLWPGNSALPLAPPTSRGTWRRPFW